MYNIISKLNDNDYRHVQCTNNNIINFKLLFSEDTKINDRNNLQT